MTASHDALGLDAFLDAGPTPADVPAGDNFMAWRLRRLSAAEFAALGERGASAQTPCVAQLAYLCWLNSLAPTSHNTTPQRFRLDGDAGEIELWLDRQLVLAASDSRARQACVSLGCGVANMELGARALGWRVELEVAEADADTLAPHVEGQPRFVRVARLRVRPEPGAPGSTPDWIGLARARKVIRSEYDERVELPGELIAELEDVVAGVEGVELHLLRDGPTRLFIGKFQELADTTVLNRDKYALELGEWLREDADPWTRGMRGAEFGLSAESTQRFHRGLLREIELLPDEVAGFARVGNVGMRTSSAIAVLTVDEDSLARRLAAGRVYQELALRLWAHRFCTAMHAGIVEVEGPNMALRGRLRTRWRPTALFRIGRPLREEDWMRPHSARPWLSDLMLPDPT